MLTVEHKDTREAYEVYNVRNDKNGYPHFLIYDFEKNAWKWVSAKYYKPYVCEFYLNEE